MNTESIEQATGQPWAQWVSELDALGARDLSHSELAQRVSVRLEGRVPSPGWWAQGIAVAYEQHTGKRQPGQVADGTYEIAVSKTVAGSRPDVFPRVVAWFEAQPDLNGQAYKNARTSVTPVRSYWRCDLADGTKFTVAVEEAGEKSRVVCSHAALSAQEEAAAWKEFWRQTLAQLA